MGAPAEFTYRPPNKVGLSVGCRARKVGGSYQAAGTIVSIFETTTNKVRCVFEFDEPPGLLHIFNPTQLEAE